MIFAGKFDVPQAILTMLSQTIDFKEKTPKFFINIQRELRYQNSPLLLRPHYAVFNDAVLDHQSIKNNSYNKGISFKKALIIPMMETPLKLDKAQEDFYTS